MLLRVTLQVRNAPTSAKWVLCPDTEMQSNVIKLFGLNQIKWKDTHEWPTASSFG